MKKLAFITVLFLSLQGFAQKTVTIYNLSTTNFDIGEIDTKSTSANGYPRFISNYGTAPNNIIHIPAGTTYVLTASPASTTRFPFYSPTSSPQITSWYRRLTATGTSTALASNVVATTYGNTQLFDFMKTQVGPNGTLGGGNLRPNDPSLSFYSYNSINGLGAGTVDITQDPPGTPGGTLEVTVIIVD